MNLLHHTMGFAVGVSCWMSGMQMLWRWARMQRSKTSKRFLAFSMERWESQEYCDIMIDAGAYTIAAQYLSSAFLHAHQSMSWCFTSFWVGLTSTSGNLEFVTIHAKSAWKLVVQVLEGILCLLQTGWNRRAVLCDYFLTERKFCTDSFFKHDLKFQVYHRWSSYQDFSK